MSDTQLGNEVLDLGKAIGLFNDGGSLQTHWFNDPLQNIESIFTVDTQRAAFLRVLDALLAPVQLPDIPANLASSAGRPDAGQRVPHHQHSKRSHLRIRRGVSLD